VRGRYGLTLVVAGGQHCLVCRAAADVPYLTSIMQEHALINQIILIIKINDVNLQKRKRKAQL